MSSDRERLWLTDIVDYSTRAIAFLEDRTAEALAADLKSLAAIERCLMCVTEAAIRIGPDRMTTVAPDVPLHVLRGMANRLRHNYDDIDLETIRRTVKEDLPRLRDAAVAALGEAE